VSKIPDNTLKIAIAAAYRRKANSWFLSKNPRYPSVRLILANLGCIMTEARTIHPNGRMEELTIGWR
jgi:hypothetical protein